MEIVRGALYPREGHFFMEADYKQIEVRISTCYNKDKKLISDVLEGDMHRDMATEIFKIDSFSKSVTGHDTVRSATKNGFVFPQFYGDYYKNCAELLLLGWGKLPKGRWSDGQGIDFEDKKLSDHLIKKGIRSYQAFEKHLQKIEWDFWNKRYMEYARWKDMIWKRYQKRGFITSKTGFTFSGLMNKKDVTNYPIQGSAFHCLLWSLIELEKAQRRERWDTKIIGQIHDSIILDVHPDEFTDVSNVIKCIMCNDVRQHWKWITIPLEIDFELHPVDGSWAEKIK